MLVEGNHGSKYSLCACLSIFPQQQRYSGTPTFYVTTPSEGARALSLSWPLSTHLLYEHSWFIPLYRLHYLICFDWRWLRSILLMMGKVPSQWRTAFWSDLFLLIWFIFVSVIQCFSIQITCSSCLYNYVINILYCKCKLNCFIFTWLSLNKPCLYENVEHVIKCFY